jgi:hypothetical protein
MTGSDVRRQGWSRAPTNRQSSFEVTAMNATHHVKRTITLVSSLTLLAGLFPGLITGPAIAQDVRGLGMGGALLPGPSLAQYNPAYAAYDPSGFQPGGLEGGFSVPLGLINIFLRPSMNPLALFNNVQNKNSAALTNPNTAFDALAFIDQVYNLNTFIINPPSAPKRLNINYDNEFGISLTDENNAKIDLGGYNGQNGSGAGAGSNGVGTSNFTPTFRFGNLELGIGIFAGTQGPSFSTDAALSASLASGQFATGVPYGFTARAKGSAGISLGLAYAGGIPISSPETGDLTLYVGGRARGFYGLAYGDLNVQGNVTIDPVSKQPKPDYTTTSFVSYIGKGYGFGINSDLGLAVDLPVNGDQKSVATFGLGVINLVNYTTWSGEETTSTPDSSGALVSSSKPASRTDAVFNPLFTVNAGYSFRIDEIASRVFIAADAQVGQGKFAAHLGAEAKLGPVFARGGIGYDRGLILGLGAGLIFAPNLGADLALTTHTAPFTNHLDFGIALALRLGF